MQPCLSNYRIPRVVQFKTIVLYCRQNERFPLHTSPGRKFSECAARFLIHPGVYKFDTPKNSKLFKISSLKIMFKEPYFSQYFMDSSSKFELDCVESKNSYILLINVINFKLRLINYVYIFLRHPEEF